MAPLALAATDYIPCSDPCDGGDVNYHLVASVRTVSLLNYTYRGRLFSSGDGRAGGLDDDDGATAFLGPTLRVRPGQSLWVKLTNDLTSAPDEWGSRPPTVHNYWKMLQNPGEKIKYRYYRRTVADPSLMAVDASNMPGDFDATNLHLHGKSHDVLQWMSRPRPPWTRPPRPRRRETMATTLSAVNAASATTLSAVDGAASATTSSAVDAASATTSSAVDATMAMTSSVVESAGKNHFHNLYPRAS